MKLDPTVALISLLAGAFPLAAVIAFFLYVSPLTIIYVATIVIGMMFMFALGLVAGGRKSENHSGSEGHTQVVIARGTATPGHEAAGQFVYRPE